MIAFRSPRAIGRALAVAVMTAPVFLMAPLTSQAALAHASIGDTTGPVRTSVSAVGDVVDDFPKYPPEGCSGYWTFAPFDKAGKFPCSTTVLGVIWPDGHYEYFGIGTNWQVYRTTQSSNGWQSMGGRATDTWMAYINGDGHPTIAVFNVNAAHKIWCKQYISPSWKGWYACGAY